jgi:hypothetical protein
MHQVVEGGAYKRGCQVSGLQLVVCPPDELVAPIRLTLPALNCVIGNAASRVAIIVVVSIRVTGVGCISVIAPAIMTIILVVVPVTRVHVNSRSVDVESLGVSGAGAGQR